MSRRKPPESLDAWELVQRGLLHFYRINKGETDESRSSGAVATFQQPTAPD